MVRHLFWKGGWVALLLLAAGAGFGAFGWSERAASLALADHGVAAEATIEAMEERTRRVRSKNGMRTETDHLVTYAYETVPPGGGQPVPRRVTHEVPGWLYNELNRGQRVTVTYLPEDPETVDYFAGESRRAARFSLWFAAGFALAAAGTMVFAYRLARRAHRLDVAGLPVEGEVEAVHRAKSSWSLGVRFTDSRGQVRRATTATRFGAKVQGPVPGERVALRYDPEDPSNVVLA